MGQRPIARYDHTIVIYTIYFPNTTHPSSHSPNYFTKRLEIWQTFLIGCRDPITMDVSKLKTLGVDSGFLIFPV